MRVPVNSRNYTVIFFVSLKGVKLEGFISLFCDIILLQLRLKEGHYHEELVNLHHSR